MTNSVAFLVDADNVSSVLVEEAIKHLRKSGKPLRLRRAYGGHEKLMGLKEVLRKHAFRTFVNHGKGTTDVAVAVDAMDLLHGDLLPSTVAIASSDADFAALVVRLREAGVRVLCFAHRMAADADALQRVYDEVIFDDMLSSAEALARAALPAPLPVAQKLPLAISVIMPVEKPEDAETVRRILAALTEWQPNTVKQLNQLGTPLREAGVKTGSKPLHEMFRKYPAYFKVMPTSGSAKQVKLLKMPATV